MDPARRRLDPENERAERGVFLVDRVVLVFGIERIVSVTGSNVEQLHERSRAWPAHFRAGEGWSDYLALFFTSDSLDDFDRPRGMGSWLIFQEDIVGAGIRPAPYTRDMKLNPLTYDDLNNAGQAGGVSIPHGVGTVFATALWDMTVNLVDQHGFDPDHYTGTGGNNIALQLVLDGMKMQPCGPTFLDARDAILDADQVNNGGANECLIWEAFARRGMGINADDGGSASSLNVTADFTRPDQCENLDVILSDSFETTAR